MPPVPNKQIKVSKAYQKTNFYTDQKQLQNKLPWLYTKTTHHLQWVWWQSNQYLWVWFYFTHYRWWLQQKRKEKGLNSVTEGS